MREQRNVPGALWVGVVVIVIGALTIAGGDRSGMTLVGLIAVLLGIVRVTLSLIDYARLRPRN